MNKIKNIIFILLLVAAAGIAYSIVTLKNIPEVFDWDLDDE